MTGEKSFVDPEMVMANQMLDAVLSKYHEIMMRKKKEKRKNTLSPHIDGG